VLRKRGLSGGGLGRSRKNVVATGRGEENDVVFLDGREGNREKLKTPVGAGLW